ncbi:MAG: hypothetical protein IH975_01090 [Nitrospinae bacterium]|nr:hypothetical protein [Nitrospinota bacterium]
MKKYRIKLQVRGLESDDGYVRLNIFVTHLHNLRSTLINVDRMVSRKRRASAYYRVIELDCSSPATIVIEAQPFIKDIDNREEVEKRFFGGMRQIKETGTAPENLDRAALEQMRGLASQVGKTVVSATISNGEHTIDLTEGLKAKIDVLLAEVDSTEGSIEGMLEAINIHKEANVFRIYPVIGPKKVSCHFPNRLREDAIRAVDSFVSIEGTLKYMKNAPFPHEIKVSKIEVYPPEDELPSLEDLRGIAPNATGDLSSEEFVRKIRDEWE